MKKKIFYWSPFTSYVATVKSVVNSSESINIFSNNSKSFIINAVGEWDSYKDELQKKKIETINLNSSKYFKKFNKTGFLKSRISYLYIFFKSFIPLKKLIEEKKPDYLIVHLITSLPILLFWFFNFETKLILRISGLPKMTFFRKLLWKIGSKKIFKITCPTEATYKNMGNYDFFKEKLTILYDPIIKCSEIQNNIKRNKINLNYDLKQFIEKNDFYLAIGRLTKQKNFSFLIDCISNLKNNNIIIKLLIIGDGEQKNELMEKISKYNLQKDIKIMNYSDNVFFFLKKSKAFILSSLWEDPGFVLIEAAYMNTTVISSDCPNGPVEILNNQSGGYLFRSNDKNSFLKTFNSFLSSSKVDIFNKKKNIKITSKKYSMFNHYKDIEKILI